MREAQRAKEEAKKSFTQRPTPNKKCISPLN